MKPAAQPPVTLDADLTFSVETGSHLVSGTVRAAGSSVTIFVDDPAAFMSSGTVRRGGMNDVVGMLAQEGVTIIVEGPKGVIASVGAIRPSPLSRVISGSPHVRLGAVGALVNALKSSTGAPQIELPPSTIFPILPTVTRAARRRVTTTHYLRGSGRPRLIFVVGSDVWDGRPPREFALLDGTTTIGSSAEADLRLDGLEAIHAEIRHDDNDDYILQVVAGDADYVPILVQGEPTRSRGRILRTGARIELGQWRMGFFREEFADHGRPYGGRTGGELAHQKRQPGRRGDRA